MAGGDVSSVEGLKLSPKKCLLFQSEVPFLGKIDARDEVKTDPQKVVSAQDWLTNSLD